MAEYITQSTISTAEQSASAGLNPTYVKQIVTGWLRTGTFKEVDIPEAVRNLRIGLRRIEHEHRDHLLGD